jgi:hypothetical protein
MTGVRLMRARAAIVAAVIACLCGALAATAAAEAPEYGRCVKHAGGSFATSKCTAGAAGSGDWEWQPGPGPKAHFSASLKGTTTFVWWLQDGGYPGECKGASLSGDYTGPKTVGNVHLNFTGCSYPVSEGPEACSTIEVAPLVGELGVYALGETAEKNKIGLKLSPETGTSLAEIHCRFERSYNWRGGFVIAQTTSNVMQLAGTLAFRQHHPRTPPSEEQLPANFLGEPANPLETTDNSEIEHVRVWTQMGWAMSLGVHNEERIEANSVI